jgi:early secretory antigenic target protein ESAT-6
MTRRLSSVSGIKVTPEQLQSVAGRLGAGSSQIEATLQQLASQVAPLGSDWAGVAQANFVGLWEQWQRDGAGLHQALTGISTLMRQAGSSYEQTEQANARAFAR